MQKYSLGLDVGSTTIKTAVLDKDKKLVYSSYDRHFSDIRATLGEVLSKCLKKFPDSELSVIVTGSGGISVSKWLGIPFMQEVIAGVRAIEEYLPDCDVAIELGGEDAKITYLTGGVEQRMNGTCAGGTGAFIDQMATLLNTDADGLNSLAKDAKTIYPIASRCGVFAKSDIQPLLNDGATKQDIAASVLYSVVTQTISGLACGKPIKGVVAFLGGPLYFMTELREAFIKTINPAKSYFPDNSQIFNALGAALAATDTVLQSELLEKLELLKSVQSHEVERLPALFTNKEELAEFTTRHAKAKLKTAPISDHRGECFLGIDAGSTTTKVALINSDGELLYKWYGANRGEPLETIKKILLEIYAVLPKDAFIARATVTGYGEQLLKATIKVDDGEIETMAHLTASNAILPGVEFILDIGGQDMKCLRIKDGVISEILLNEACSSGCGSFIETFAIALKLSAAEFAEKGTKSSSPVDLGTRCTVFMNSRVKQAQKEGATVEDISAGLAYSVVKNALFKVIKMREPSDMGEKIMVQGGTFLNNSVLRAFELTAKRDVVRPDEAGLMGAYGAALLSKKNYKEGRSTILDKEKLLALSVKKTTTICNRCENKCKLTITTSNNGEKYITNNRCELGAGKEQKDASAIPNMYAYKYDRLFNYYKPLELKDAFRGRVGIPRALNMYENYPFWFTFLTELGYRVELSPHSSRAIYNKGIESMPSESVCYPAKIVHGHIEALVEAGHNLIFYPCLPFEKREDEGADNHFNCPVVGTYPEVIRCNMQESIGLHRPASGKVLKKHFDGYYKSLNLPKNKIDFITPFLPFNNLKRLIQRLSEEFSDIPKKEIAAAVKKADLADQKFKNDVACEGERVLDYLEKTGKHGIVLAGRPYHLDPEINHGIPEAIIKFGLAVITEDALSHLGKLPRPIRVMDQWTYHSRMYSAADFVRRRNNLDLMQLISFGCGLDAVAGDQVAELLVAAGKPYTSIKIDEINSLGAAKIRLRSLIALIEERKEKAVLAKTSNIKSYNRIHYTKKMNETYTLLAPEISPFHLTLLEAVMRNAGYDLTVLQNSDKALEAGLKYVNHDACYPTILVVGQLMEAVLSGRYDTNKLGLMMAQTGGPCRATNYIPLIRKALKDAGYENIPVISLNFVGLEKNEGFKMTMPLLISYIRAVIYGDLLLRVVLKTRPYEKEKGATNAMYEKWNNIVKQSLCSKFGGKNFKKNIHNIVKDFASIPCHDVVKPRIGVVGEILVKFHPVANNQIVDFIESEGCEAVMPDFTDFYTYSFFNQKVRNEILEDGWWKKIKGGIYIWFIEKFRSSMYKALEGTKYGRPNHIINIAKEAGKVVSLGNIAGEGWFLTGEMVELIQSGVENIACLQPFACLPNHVTGKGVVKELKRQYPNSNIVAIDYDPGASEVNQINRIKLMLNTAFKNLQVDTISH